MFAKIAVCKKNAKGEPVKDENGKPTTASRYRKNRLFQWLEKTIGLPTLRKHIAQLITIVTIANGDKNRFNRYFMRVFKPESLPLLPNLPYNWQDDSIDPETED